MKNLASIFRTAVAAAALGLLAASSAFADYTVTGRFLYEDRTFDLSGFTGITQRPIRFADVRIMAGNTELARVATLEDGSFSVAVPGSTAQSITALCVTSSNPTAAILLDVRVAIDTSSLSGDLYSVTSANQNATGTAAVDMGTTLATADTDVGKAFNIWDVVNDSLQFVASSNANGAYPSKKLTVIWGSSQTRTGSFFSYNGTDRYIYVGVDACFDDTVIAHEFGHYIDNLYSKSNSPGGIHYLGDDAQDIRLSWGEGLATFLGSSARKYKEYSTPEIYVSTDGRNLNFSFELERLNGSSALASKTGSTNEVAVTAALWDIIDGPGDYTPAGDDDTMQKSFSDVWKVLNQYFPSVTLNAYSIETFWNGWLATYNPTGSELAAIQDAFNKVNGIEFVADVQEPDDNSSQAPLITLPQRPSLVTGAKVVISEVDPGSVDAAELYNAGNVEADLTGWTLVASAPPGLSTTFTLPSFKLAPGAFVVLSEASRTNTNSLLYFNKNISWANGSDGSCALQDDKGVGIDFVRWGNASDSAPSGTSFNGTNPAAPASGYNLARNFDELDSDSGSDWTSQTTSMGTYNITGQERHHTFFSTGDADYVAFNATKGNYYMAETFRLFNGADTILDVVAADGVTALATNDDYGNSNTSRLAWTAPSTGKFYVRARRFDGPANFAQYGSYDLRVIESASPFSLALPQTLTVSQTGQGGKFQYVADAITAAFNGDTVQILDNGTYAEAPVISGKSMTLKAAPGKNPVIDARNGHSTYALTISGAKTVNIDGITILAGARGLRVAGGDLVLTNSVITGASDSAGFSDGIQVSGSGSSASIVNCTITNNGRAGVGVFSSGVARVSNSIVQNNGSVDIGKDATAVTLTVSNSLVGTGEFNGTRGNITGDPQFVDSANNDFRLKSTSPAIDKGDSSDPKLPATDADGLPRSIDGKNSGRAIPDMGAYEYLPPGTLTSTSIFPQIAAGGTNPPYRTSIVGINTGSVAANVSLSLTKSNGNPFPITVLNSAESLPNSPSAPQGEPLAAGRTGNSFNFAIPAGGLARYEASASGDTASGYAKLLSSVPVTGTALFKTMNNDAIQSEAGVGLSKPARSFFVYVDNTSSANSGYAVANYGSTPANITLTLRDANGAQKDTATISLNPGNHKPEFAGTRFSNTAPAGFEGSIEFASDQPVAAVALRYDNPGQDVFSTIPVLVDEASTTLYFPQVADGGGYRTNFILVNSSANPTFAKIEFFQNDGSPLGLPIDKMVQTSVNVPLFAKGVAHLLTDGTSSGTQVGWVRVTSSEKIGGSAIFQTLSGARITSEAGVSSSPSAVHSTAYVSSIGFTESGLAICNPNSTAVTVTLNLRDTSGQVVATTSVPLGPLGHVAKFFTQWFPTGYGEFEGTLEVVATGAVSAVALRYDNKDDILVPKVFATLPVIVIP